MNEKIIKQIIEDLENNKSLLDCQKADFLYMLKIIYGPLCQPFIKYIDELIEKLD